MATEDAVETTVQTAAESAVSGKEGGCWELAVYTENQVGLLSSIAGMFTRRSINIERLLVYPSQIPGVHKFSIRAWAPEDKIRQIVLQMEKKVDVIRVFCYEHPNHTAHEVETVEEFLSGHGVK